MDEGGGVESSGFLADESEECAVLLEAQFGNGVSDLGALNELHDYCSAFGVELVDEGCGDAGLLGSVDYVGFM